MGNHFYTMLITAEDFAGNIQFALKNVKLYEIMAIKKAVSALSTPSVQHPTAYTFSIREVLQGVKDVDGNPYINPDGSGNFAVYNQTAYHGSPHKFDTFDLGAIGTGEGAQVQG